MSNNSTFDEILEAVEHLPVEQQSDLVGVIQRRLAERGRKQVVADVQEARAEFASGGAKATSVEDLMKELRS